MCVRFIRCLKFRFVICIVMCLFGNGIMSVSSRYMWIIVDVLEGFFWIVGFDFGCR